MKILKIFLYPGKGKIFVSIIPETNKEKIDCIKA